jgi:hypothetical protein
LGILGEGVLDTAALVDVGYWPALLAALCRYVAIASASARVKR